MARARAGEGRPYQRASDGLWVVAVRDPDGKRKYLYGSSPSAVIERRDEYMGGLTLGLDLASTKLTVGRQLEDWLEDRRGKVRSSTWVSYESHVRIHLRSLRHVPLIRLRPADVRRLIRNREAEGCAPATVRYSLTILRMAIAQAVTDGILPRNVAVSVPGPRVEKVELGFLTADQVRHLVASAYQHPSGRLWTVLVGTGLRLGEGLGLRRQDVDVDRARISVVKSLRPVDRRFRAEREPRLQLTDVKTAASRRTIAVPSFVVAALQAEFAVDRPANVDRLIFTGPTGAPIDKRNALKAWVTFRTLTNLPAIRIHDLRHTAASLVLANGGTLFDVMKMLGHSSISETAETYGHLVEGRSRELADGMDRMVAAGSQRGALALAPDAAVFAAPDDQGG